MVQFQDKSYLISFGRLFFHGIALQANKMLIPLYMPMENVKYIIINPVISRKYIRKTIADK